MSSSTTHRLPDGPAAAAFEIDAPQGPAQHWIALGSAVALLVYAAFTRPRWLRTAFALAGIGVTAVQPATSRDPAGNVVGKA